MKKTLIKCSLITLATIASTNTLADPYVSAGFSGQNIEQVDSYNKKFSYNANVGYAFTFIPGPVSPIVEVGLRDWGNFIQNQATVKIGPAYDAMGGLQIRVPFIGVIFAKAGAMYTTGAVDGGNKVTSYMPVAAVGLGYAFPYLSVYAEYLHAYGKTPTVTNGNLNALPSMNSGLIGVQVLL